MGHGSADPHYGSLELVVQLHVCMALCPLRCVIDKKRCSEGDTRSSVEVKSKRFGCSRRGSGHHVFVLKSSPWLIHEKTISVCISSGNSEEFEGVQRPQTSSGDFGRLSNAFREVLATCSMGDQLSERLDVASQ